VQVGELLHVGYQHRVGRLRLGRVFERLSVVVELYLIERGF